jgi:glycosyltransferase involved in cell wall biosynthesis
VLEAMAMGKAVIATNWGGPADYLDTQSGILIAPDTALGFTSAFADAMVTLASDPDTCDAMGRHGQHLIKTKYDWQVKIDNILEIYRSVAFASP